MTQGKSCIPGAGMALIFLSVEYHPGISLEPRQNLRGFIRGAVVDDHRFQGEAPLLIQHGLYAFFQVWSIVIAGDDHADVNAAVLPLGRTLHAAAAAGVLPDGIQRGLFSGAQQVAKRHSPLTQKSVHGFLPFCS